MSKGFIESFMEIPGPGTALTASTTQTSLLLGVTGSMPTLPAGYFERIGKPLWLKAWGRITTVTTPGTLNLYLRSATSSIDLFDSLAMTLNATAQTTVLWSLDVFLVARAIGNSTTANLAAFGSWTSGAVIGASAVGTGGATSQMLPYNSAGGTVGAGFDSTISHLLDIQGKWGTNNANSIRIEGGFLGLFN